MLNMVPRIPLRWLHKPTVTTGVTWGVPWRKGELSREELPHLVVSRQQHEAGLPLQSRPAAYWPDGSVKWSFPTAICEDSQVGDGEWILTEGTEPKDVDVTEMQAPPPRVTVRETQETFIIDTGVMTCIVNKQGRGLLRSIHRKSDAAASASTDSAQDAAGMVQLCDGGELICIREVRDRVSGTVTIREESFAGHTRRVLLEQDGPLQAVLKLEGRHRSVSSSGTREWLPYTLRLYFHAGLDSIRLVHTFHYDGNPHQDYIRGLGIRFSIPMRGPLYNRHVRFGGDRGLFSESPKTLHTRRTKGKYQELFTDQTEGRPVAFDADEEAYFLNLLADSDLIETFCENERDVHMMDRTAKPAAR